MARRIALVLTYSDSFLFKHNYSIDVDGKGDIYITEIERKENERQKIK